MIKVDSTLPLGNTPEREDVAKACQLLVHLGLDSGPFGNISIKVPGKDEFWHNPTGITFPLLKTSDIVRVDYDGNVVEGHYLPHPGEFIHRQIYKLRPDVKAIVHTHSPATVLHSLMGELIEPYTQLGASLHGDQGIYLGFSGPVRDSDEGTAIAKALGDKSIVIAKNHGLFAASDSIQLAFWDMVVADMAANIHVEAKKMGLGKASMLKDSDLIKSKVEVRKLQSMFMWESLYQEMLKKA